MRQRLYSSSKQVVILTMTILILNQTVHWSTGYAVSLEQSNFFTLSYTPAGDFSTFLPFIITPIDQLLPSPEVTLRITPQGAINASTYNSHSFILINHPTHTKQITEVRINLTTAAFPDMVFDPFGLAGDQVAKDLAVDGGGTATGYLNRTFAGSHDDGYDEIILQFSHFDPGEQFSFSIDVDPTSIRGVEAPGPRESGSVCGLELAGATVTVTFADAQILTGQTYYTPGDNGPSSADGGSEVLVRDGVPEPPGVTVLGVPTTPAVVTSPYQTIHITGLPGRQVQLVVVEGGLFRDGLPGGGFDIDPFEANSARWMQEYSGSINSSGFVDIPVILFNTDPDAGLNHIIAVQVNPFGFKGATSTPIVLELENP